VPSVCPIVRRLRATHDLMRYLRLARSSSLTQWIRQIKLVPKLTVWVRFPSPDQDANAFATAMNPRTPTLSTTLRPAAAYSGFATTNRQRRVVAQRSRAVAQAARRLCRPH